MHDLRELIADRIATSGPISFAEFMEVSLYHPELGYYARAARNTGRAGDFFTSVDVGPLFGEMLARQLGEMWGILRHQSLPFDLVEAGAGDGRLSRDILDAAQRTDPDFYSTIRLSLVERSQAAREAQPATLGPHAALLTYNAAAVPEHINGTIVANELLDALPNHPVVMTHNGLREVFVDVENGAFVERLEDPSTPRIAEYLSRAGAAMPIGARAEVNLAAEDWIKAASTSLDRGFMVIIDYGHDQEELYGGSHGSGTLASFKQHTQLSDVLQSAGECDITAHVDLTAVRRAAERSGLQLLGALDQTYFMLGLAGADLETMSLRQRLALKTLMLPGGLGSTHKVLVFGKDVGTPPLKGLSYRVRLT
jgi:SAM-dependent MidA family methyltransferase